MIWIVDPGIQTRIKTISMQADAAVPIPAIKPASWAVVGALVGTIAFTLFTYWVSTVHHVLYHQLMETLTVVLASFACILALVIGRRDQGPLVRTAAGFSGLIVVSFAHMFYYAYADFFIGPFRNTNGSLSIVYAAVEAVFLLIAVTPLFQRVPAYVLAIASAAMATVLVALNFSTELFPVAYRPSAGPTAFGIAFQLAYALVIVASLWLLRMAHKRGLLCQGILQFLVLAITAKLASEFAVIFSADGPFRDLLEHVLKVAGFALIIVPLLIEGIVQPQAQATHVRSEQRGLLEELRRHSATLEAVLGATLDLVFMTDREGRFLFVSRSFEQLAGASNDQIAGQTWRTLGLEPVVYEAWQEAAERVLATGLPVRKEVGDCGGSGSGFFELEVAPVVGEAFQTPIAVVTVCRDISSRKQMEEELRTLLDDNRVLLVEVHHRVKNNLQIVSSILQMQAWRTPDPLNRVLFEEAGGRILSLARLHELLYKSGNFSHVEFGLYMVNLCRELFSVYGIRPDHIRLVMNCAPINLHIDKAVPLAFIVHELITNCIKHAFAKSGGTIRLTFHLDWDGRAMLSVADDGVGLSGETTARKGALGLKMIAMLVRQLRGEMQQRQGNGTEVTIYFPLDPPQQSDALATQTATTPMPA